MLRRRSRVLAPLSTIAIAIASTLLGSGAAATEAITSTLIGNVGQGGVSVELFTTGSSTTPTASNTSAPDGSYSFSGLSAGSYQVRFSKAGWITEWYGGDEDRPSAATVLLEDDTVTDASATLDPGGKITISYRSAGVPNGSEYSSTEYETSKYLGGNAWQVDRTGTIGSTTGTFTFVSTTTKPLRFRFRNPDGRSSTDPYAGEFYFWSGNSFTAEGAASVQVGSGETKTLTVEAPGTAMMTGFLSNTFEGRIKGYVVPLVDIGTPTDPVVVPIQRAGFGGPSTNSSLSTGYKTPVPAGLPVTVQGHGGPRHTAGYLGDSATAQSALYRALAAGEVRANETIKLTGGANAEGRVVDSAQQPVAGATVTARSSAALVSVATTDKRGYYSLPGLIPYDPFSNFQMVDWSIQVTGEGGATGSLSGASAKTNWWNGGYPIPDGVMSGSVPQITVSYPPEHVLHLVDPPAVAGKLIYGVPVTLMPPSYDTTPAGITYTWKAIPGSASMPSTSPTFTALPPELGGASDYELRVVATRPGYESVETVIAVGPFEPYRAVAQPTVRGDLVAGSTLTAAPGAFNATPLYESLAWDIAGADVGYGSKQLLLLPAMVGKRVRLTHTGYVDGTMARGTWTSASVVRASSSLRARATARRGRAKLSLQLRTPGTATPKGLIRIYRGKRLLAKVDVTGPQMQRALTVRLPRGRQTLTVTYSGSTLATAATAKVRVRVP